MCSDRKHRLGSWESPRKGQVWGRDWTGRQEERGGDVGSCGPQEARPCARMARRLVLGDQGRVPSTREVLARRGRSPGCCSWPPAPPASLCRPQTDSCAQTPPQAVRPLRMPSPGARTAGGAPSAHAQPGTPFYGRCVFCACPANGPFPAGGAVSELIFKAAEISGPSGSGFFAASWGGSRGNLLWPYARGPSPVWADSEIKVALAFPNAFLIYRLTEN